MVEVLSLPLKMTFGCSFLPLSLASSAKNFPSSHDKFRYLISQLWLKLRFSFQKLSFQASLLRFFLLLASLVELKVDFSHLILSKIPVQSLIKKLLP